jgi:hypothetical protein
MKYKVGHFYGYPLIVECDADLPEKFFAERFDRWVKIVEKEAIERYKQQISG